MQPNYQITWQVESVDYEDRRNLIKEIHKLLKTKRTEDGVSPFELLPRHLQVKSTEIIRDMECLLYLKAASKEEYLDRSTLKDRLRQLKYEDFFPNNVETNADIVARE